MVAKQKRPSARFGWRPQKPRCGAVIRTGKLR